jgi:hypothetical protein
MSEEAQKRIGGEPLMVPVVHAEGPLPYRGLVPGVGVLPFKAGDLWFLAIIVRLGLRFDGIGNGGNAVPILTGEKVVGDLPSRFKDRAGGILDAATDFVPMKTACDVVVVGHAHARTPTETIRGGIRLLAQDGRPLHSVGFVARSGALSAMIPLVAPYLSSPIPGTAGRLGPVGVDGRFVEGIMSESVDPQVFSCASPELVVPFGLLSPISLIELTGLLPYEDGDEPVAGDVVATRLCSLPGLKPVVTVDASGVEDMPLRPLLDTVIIDTDAQRGALVWRATAGPFSSLVDVARVLVSMEMVGRERDTGERRSDTQRGKVGFATTEDDARQGREPSREDPRLRYEELRTWGEIAPEPRISLERYATVSAELAEWPKDRATTLERHEFDEVTWGVEERGWLERFASDAMNGKGELAGYYGTLFLAAQDRLATPEEERLTLRDYAGLRAEIERAADVSQVLDDAKLTLAQWMRLDRRYTQKVQDDPKVAAELDALMVEFSRPEDDADDLDLDYTGASLDDEDDE